MYSDRTAGFPGIGRMPSVTFECLLIQEKFRNTVKEIKLYQKKWLQHVQRMDKSRLPKVATTFTEDGHKQSTNCGYNMYRGWTQTHYQIWLQIVQRIDTD